MTEAENIENVSAHIAAGKKLILAVCKQYGTGGRFERFYWIDAWINQPVRVVRECSLQEFLDNTPHASDWSNGAGPYHFYEIGERLNETDDDSGITAGVYVARVKRGARASASRMPEERKEAFMQAHGRFPGFAG